MKGISFISSQQIGEKWSISKCRVQILYEEGRIPGALKIVNTWAIPDDVQSLAILGSLSIGEAIMKGEELANVL